MANLESTIRSCYEDIGRAPHSYCNCEIPIAKTIYMTIPVTEDKFEVPLFALDYLVRISDSDMDLLAVTLESIGKKSYYKTIDASIKAYLGTDLHSYHLIKLPTKEGESKYYCSHGAIFDEDFIPVMLMTWEMEKVESSSADCPYKLKVLRPILRISPKVVLYKSNSVERYIINRILPSSLALYHIYNPYVRGCSKLELNGYGDKSFKVKVIIENIPFELKKPDTPSISTTNEELMKVALDNLEEIAQ